jgi:hypothetical protein
MGRILRNGPCPCGSGRKYKKCCLLGNTASQSPYTTTDRHSVWQKLLSRFEPRVLDGERERFWGKHYPLLRTWKDPALLDMAEVVFQFWLCFDVHEEGETFADLFLEDEEEVLPPGERRYLETVRASVMRLYEVVAVQPGAGITLRDVLGGQEVRVSERAGSRCVHTWDLVAARVVAKGASGHPEIDGGILPLRGSVRGPLVAHLERLRAELDDADHREHLAVTFGDVWVTPSIPKMVNYDGEESILAKVHFDVSDEAALTAALDRHRDLERHGDEKVWSWVGTGKNRPEPIIRAFLRLSIGHLLVETNSRERAEGARTLVERLAGPAVKCRATEYQDLEQAVARDLREGTRPPRELPTEMQEPARQATVQMLSEHYDKWVDEPVPMLDDTPPREAAKVAALRPRLAGMIEDLERLYERALEEGTGAYDPTWMWEELGIEDLARGRSRRPEVPRLPHEVVADLDPELAEVAADIGDRARRSTHDDPARVIDRQEIEGDLGFHRIVRGSVREAAEDGAPPPEATAEGDMRASWIGVLANFECHLRKTFWVDEGLSWMLGATELEVTGEALRAPFASFALVLTDRYALGLAERLLADDPRARLRGRILSALTVYVTASIVSDERTDWRVAFAAEAGDGGFPELVVRDLLMRSDAGIAEILRTLAPGDDGESVSTIVASPPLKSLLGLVFNAVLYATSADAELVAGDPRGPRAPEPRRRRNGERPPSDGVYRLPGKIDITSLRQLKRVRRGASDVQAVRRCMVRGHWRRAGTSWKDPSRRWIKPYWRGPSAAAVVEREYRLR